MLQPTSWTSQRCQFIARRPDLFGALPSSIPEADLLARLMKWASPLAVSLTQSVTYFYHFRVFIREDNTLAVVVDALPPGAQVHIKRQANDDNRKSRRYIDVYFYYPRIV